MPGPDRDPGGGRGGGETEVHVLQLPGDDIGAVHEALHGSLVIEGGRDLDVGNRAGRSPLVAAGEHGDPVAMALCRLRQHPAQLPAAHDADHRRRHEHTHEILPPVICDVAYRSSSMARTCEATAAR